MRVHQGDDQTGDHQLLLYNNFFESSSSQYDTTPRRHLHAMYAMCIARVTVPPPAELKRQLPVPFVCPLAGSSPFLCEQGVRIGTRSACFEADYRIRARPATLCLRVD